MASVEKSYERLVSLSPRARACQLVCAGSLFPPNNDPVIRDRKSKPTEILQLADERLHSIFGLKMEELPQARQKVLMTFTERRKRKSTGFESSGWNSG